MSRPVVMQRIAAHQRRHKGFVLTDQAHAAGLTRAELRTLIDSGQLERRARRLYASTSVPRTWQQDVYGATLLAGPGAAASHDTACALFDLAGRRPGGPIEITVPDRRRGGTELADLVHRSREFGPVDVAHLLGIPVTRPARLVPDMASRMADDGVEDLVDEILCRELATLESLTGRSRALASQGRSGTVSVADALESWLEGALPESVAEQRVVRRLLAAGLPRPVRQHWVKDAAGRRLFRLDLAYPSAKLGLDYQSLLHHGGPRAVISDDLRTVRLAGMGWLVLPVVKHHLRDRGPELMTAVDVRLRERSA